jgi:SAM-dependent methyltransferase
VCAGTLRRWTQKIGREVFRCAQCGQIVVPDGVARRADGASIYESADTIFEADYYLDETNERAARAKLAYVARFCPPGTRLLDVGASYGHFLAAAAETYDGTGIEVSAAAADWGRTTFGVNVTVGSVYGMSEGRVASCGAITFWDVIEHLEDPGAAIDEIRRSLIPGGWLFVSTPDAGSLVATLMGARWHYLDPVQHINLFSRANLTRLLSDRGFTVVHHRYFGRSYRISYVVNRLQYLVSDGASPPAVTRSAVRSGFRALTVPIKLWDVVGLAARRND